MNKVFTPTVAFLALLLLNIAIFIAVLFMISNFSSFLNTQAELIQSSLNAVKVEPTATPSATVTQSVKKVVPTVSKAEPTVAK